MEEFRNFNKWGQEFYKRKIYLENTRYFYQNVMITTFFYTNLHFLDY